MLVGGGVASVAEAGGMFLSGCAVPDLVLVVLDLLREPSASILAAERLIDGMEMRLQGAEMQNIRVS